MSDPSYAGPLSPINGEVIPTDEAGATREIVDIYEKRVREAALTKPAIRDFHSKGHGCVRAEFRVLDNLPAELRIGLFASPGTYDAWIRYSNGNPTLQPDSKGDGRGMAIKLMNVADSLSGTQDFILINYPVFGVRNVVDYLALLRANPFWRFFVPDFNPFHHRVHEALIAYAILSTKVENLLNSRYWSMTAYRFGESACKYSTRPIGPASTFTDTFDLNFLRVNLAQHLADRKAEFEFMVQLRNQPERMPIEDATVEWKETAAPFVPVARITIPQQSFDAPEQMAFCENLSFTPWHCVDAHRPLGGLNRLRRVSYEVISRVRHELNHAPRKEPTGFEFDQADLGYALGDKNYAPIQVYRHLQSEAGQAFSRLSSRDALRTFPRPAIAAMLLTCGVYAGKLLPIIEHALAQPSRGLAPTTFTPPWGLDQGTFTGIVVFFVVLFAILIGGLFWAGYVAKPKSAAAASVVNHIATLLAGIGLGLKT